MSGSTILGRVAFGAGLLLVLFASAVGSPVLSHTKAADIIAALAEQIRENYVFPDKGEEAAAMLEKNAAAGEYEGLEGPALAMKLTEQLQALTKDRHFAVRAFAPGAGGAPAPAPMERRRTTPVRRVERLNGNIGYVDLRGFPMRAEVEDDIHATMRLMSGADALIFDMRGNGGGDPETVQLVCSYLFAKDKPVHLNSLYFRPANETTEFWTQPEAVRGEGFAKTPVWVLTSSYTFSGAEEFTYNLKTRQRATIVGERTGGGAHPVDRFEVADGLAAMIPVGRAINPVTGTNWEGTGVEPDVAVPADKALEKAIELALDALARSDDPQVASDAAWVLFDQRVANAPLRLTPAQLDEAAGDYGERQIVRRGEALWYARRGVSARETKMLAAEKDVFALEGVPGFRLELVRGADGGVTGVRGVYRDGHSDLSERVD